MNDVFDNLANLYYTDRENAAPEIQQEKFVSMEQHDKIQLFEDKRIRTAWDEEKEEWYFSVVDVVGVLTDSKDPAAYWR